VDGRRSDRRRLVVSCSLSPLPLYLATPSPSVSLLLFWSSQLTRLFRDNTVNNPDPFFGDTVGFNAAYEKFANHTPTTLQGSAFASGLIIKVSTRSERREKRRERKERGEREEREERERERRERREKGEERREKREERREKREERERERERGDTRRD
jgi:hypothetical protein